MGLLRRALERRSQLANPPEWLLRMFGGIPTAAGVNLTTRDAVSWTPVGAAIRLLAQSVASLPLLLYERLEPRGRRLRRDHPLFEVLHDAPNEEQSAFDFREMMQTQVLFWGNAYAQILYRQNGSVSELWPLNPDRVQRRRVGGKLWYYITMPPEIGGPRTLRADEVFHLRGWSDGVMGLALPELHRETIGLGIATEQFASRFFGDGITPAGVIEFPGALTSETSKEKLRESIQKVHGGLGKQHRVMLLEEGMKWQQVTMEPEKAQFLGLRKFQVSEASRIFGVPPHMLGDLERATFSNIEHMGLEFLIYSLRFWLVRWEQRLRLSLIGKNEYKRVYPEFLVDALLRGDTKSRYEAYAIARQWGWLSANDIREKENLNPIDGGDDYLVPLNMVPAGQAGEPNSQQVRDLLLHLAERKTDHASTPVDP